MVYFRKFTSANAPRERNWFLKKLFHDDYLQDLLDTKAGNDDILDGEVWRVLWLMRLQRRFAPFLLRIISTAKRLRQFWRDIRGKYRRARTQVHSNPAQPPGGGPGAGGLAAAFASQYTGGFSVGIPVDAPAGRTFEDAGIRTGEIIAYRAWRYGGDGLLHSVNVSPFAWMPDTRAEGDPEQYCQGIYAFKDPESVRNYFGGVSSEIVYGTVELWGTIYECTEGYRAQYAAVRSVDSCVRSDEQEILAKLRKRYKLQASPETSPNE